MRVVQGEPSSRACCDLVAEPDGPQGCLYILPWGVTALGEPNPTLPPLRQLRGARCTPVLPVPSLVPTRWVSRLSGSWLKFSSVLSTIRGCQLHTSLREDPAVAVQPSCMLVQASLLFACQELKPCCSSGQGNPKNEPPIPFLAAGAAGRQPAFPLGLL